MSGPWRGLPGRPYRPGPPSGASVLQGNDGPKEPFGSSLCPQSVLPLLSLSFSFGDIECPLSPTVLGVREGAHRMTREELRKLQKKHNRARMSSRCVSHSISTNFCSPPYGGADQRGSCGQAVSAATVGQLSLRQDCVAVPRPARGGGLPEKAKLPASASSSNLCCLPSYRGH